MKIPPKNPCMRVTILSTIKSVTNTFISWGEKTKKEHKKVCFSKEYLGFPSGAVVSKLLLGCWSHFLYIFCHYNQTGHSVMCTIYVQLQRTAWNVAFQPEVCENVYDKMCTVAHTYCFNLKSVKMCMAKRVRQKNWAALPLYLLHSTHPLL